MVELPHANRSLFRACCSESEHQNTVFHGILGALGLAFTFTPPALSVVGMETMPGLKLKIRFFDKVNRFDKRNARRPLVISSANRDALKIQGEADAESARIYARPYRAG